jgi:RNA polymerase sigma-70 factor (ECF subfamily)
MKKMQQMQVYPPLPELTDVKDGNHAAFIELYHALHIRVFRFFLKRTFLTETAKDLTQQCFIRLWQFRHTLSEDHALEKQVFIIARSLLINHLKKEMTQKKLKASHLQLAAGQQVQANAFNAFETANEINAAIASLPPVRKKILILKTFHGCTNKEIAQQMAISVKTVEDHVTKAFRHIKQLVTVLIALLYGGAHW